MNASASSRPQVRKRKILLLLIVLGIIALVVAANRREAVEVQMTSPVYQDIESTVATGGTIVPLDEFPARANFAGIVTRIYVHVGQKVHAGQRLLTMKDQYALARVENAKATLASAETAEDNIRNNGSRQERIDFAVDLRRAHDEQKSAAESLATLKQLQQKGSVSDAEVEAGVQRLQTANANLQSLDEKDTHRYDQKDMASWKTKVAAARAALAAERVSYNNANITSPISGTVYIIPVSQNDFVPMGTDLLSVADLSRIQVRAEFDEPDIAKLHSGQPVEIAWDGRPGRTWHGHVLFAPMAVTADGSRNIGQCAIAVDDANGDLPADSHVTVTVTIATHSHALTIPREALHTDGPARFVYRAVNGRLIKTSVEVGLVNAFHAEITNGLTSGDVVALRSLRGEALSDHLRVTNAE